MDNQQQENLDQHFSMLNMIGRGAFGEVYKGKNEKTGEMVAMKTLRYDTAPGHIKAAFSREIHLLKQLKHPNIVSLLYVSKDYEAHKNFYLVLELCTTDLYNYIGNHVALGAYLKAKKVKSFLHQINLGLQHCHQRGIMHRDLKPDNVLIAKDGCIKLADFGSGKQYDDTAVHFTPGLVTLWYRAPEILMRAPKYSSAIDIWSVGCIFAEMASRVALFQGDIEITQLYKIFEILGTPTEETWKGFTSLPYYKATFPKWTECNLKKSVKNLDDDGMDLLEKMLIYDPERRITAESILLHPYFEDMGQPGNGGT